VKPAGLVIYHNTIIAESRNGEIFANAHFRNNLFLGIDAPGREIFRFPNATSYSSFDYNGYRPNGGATPQYLWKAPAAGKLQDYDLERAEFRQFRTLEELRLATGHESPGVEVDFDIFERMKPPDPSTPHAIYHAKDLDFTLRPGSKAADAGVPLPNVNDDFAGKAPDLGALEIGRPAPIYGPRKMRQ